MTNLVILLTVVSTNWQIIPGDFHREGGTNMVHQHQMVSTNAILIQTYTCTNRLATTEVGSAKSGLTRWVATPDVPGQPRKE